jgi:hypothetical protein
VWIEANPENASRATRALREYGAPVADLTEADLATPGVVFQVGIEPLRVDVLARISGVSFAEAWPERVIARLDDIAVPALGRAHLIRNELATGRPKDLLDVENLERSRAK